MLRMGKIREKTKNKKRENEKKVYVIKVRRCVHKRAAMENIRVKLLRRNVCAFNEILSVYICICSWAYSSRLARVKGKPAPTLQVKHREGAERFHVESSTFCTYVERDCKESFYEIP